MNSNSSKLQKCYESHLIEIGAITDDYGDCPIIIDGINTSIIIDVDMWNNDDDYSYNWIRRKIDRYLSEDVMF